MLTKDNMRDPITVGEFIEILQKYPKDSKILVTWEIIFQTIQEDSVYVGNENIVLIDADGNFYKDRFENKIEID